MKLEVKRRWSSDEATIGELYVNSEFECFTCEDTTRPPGMKVYGKTAIPEGTYKVIIDFSQRFQKLLPHILDVPDFEGIRIHPGNGPEDTLGCILVGLQRVPNKVLSSKAAFGLLFVKMKAAFDAGEEITITVGH